MFRSFDPSSSMILNERWSPMIPRAPRCAILVLKICRNLSTLVRRLLWVYFVLRRSRQISLVGGPKEDLWKFFIVNGAILIAVVESKQRLQILALDKYWFWIVESNFFHGLHEGSIVEFSWVVDVEVFEALDEEGFFCCSFATLLLDLFLELFLKARWDAYVYLKVDISLINIKLRAELSTNCHPLLLVLLCLDFRLPAILLRTGLTLRGWWVLFSKHAWRCLQL